MALLLSDVKLCSPQDLPSLPLGARQEFTLHSAFSKNLTSRFDLRYDSTEGFGTSHKHRDVIPIVGSKERDWSVVDDDLDNGMGAVVDTTALAGADGSGCRSAAIVAGTTGFLCDQAILMHLPHTIHGTGTNPTARGLWERVNRNDSQAVGAAEEPAVDGVGELWLAHDGGTIPSSFALVKGFETTF